MAVSEIEFSLDNIIIGNTLRVFQSTDSENNINLFFTLKDEYKIKEENNLLSSNIDLNFEYIMKNKNEIRINTSYEDSFISSLKNNLNKNKDSIFYDKILTNNLFNEQNINFTQIGGKYFFVDSNKFFKPDENVISGKFELNPLQNNINYKELISGHVLSSYGAEFYDNSLKFVNDKSIPIYDLNYEALNDVDVLKFQDSMMIDEIIDYIEHLRMTKYNNLESFYSIKNDILYNSKLNKKSIHNYDSILIFPIIELYQKNEFNEDGTENILYQIGQDFLNEIFDYLFINLSLDSFYRLLIPVGKINTIFNDKINEKISTENFEEYTYYVNVNSLINLNSTLNFNYFSLKNLKNPHDEYDYEIYNINTNLTCHTDAYSFDKTKLYNILNFIDDSLIKLENYVNSYHAGEISGKFIENNNLVSALVEFGSKKYNNWSKETISGAVVKEGTWLRYKLFNDYIFNTYDKLLKEEPYLIRIKELKDYWNLTYNSYENQFKDEYYEDNVLNSYYLSGLAMIHEIDESISLILENNIEKNTTSAFITKNEAEYLKKEIGNLSNLKFQILSDKNLFKNALYKPLATNVLNKNAVIDNNLAETLEWYRNENNDRFSIKIDDYLNSYNYFYNHENVMKKDGHIFGFRKYKFINKSFTNKLFVTYDYITSFDYNFLKRHNLENDIKIKDVSSFLSLSENEFNKNYNVYLNKAIEYSTIRSDLILSAAFNINKEQSCVLENFEKVNEFKAYLAMLLTTRQFEFIDFLEGDYKYKESNIKKSNVYSIELKNSNLNYNVINYKEMLGIYLKYEDVINNERLSANIPPITGYENYESGVFELSGFEYDEENLSGNTLSATFFDIVYNELGYKEILDITMNDDLEILKKTGFEIPYSSYKFYNINDKLNKNIEMKMEVRKQLERAIRKSIPKYAPINTTLWKIKYTGL